MDNSAEVSDCINNGESQNDLMIDDELGVLAKNECISPRFI
jgi:hypothetical protein